MSIEEIVSAAAGREKVDTLFVNGKVINVFTGEIIEQNVAVKEGIVCGFGNYEAFEKVDMGGLYLAPGFMDAHVHIESAMVTPFNFAWGVLPLGTTTVIADPHEIANVMGFVGINYMLRSAVSTPMNIYFTTPSCVPATDMETAGAKIEIGDTKFFLGHHRIVALAEMMNCQGVINVNPQVMEKLRAARRSGKIVDGHAPGLSGRELCAYAAAGIVSDHECTTAGEALEKIRLGMYIMIREGTCAKNFDALLPAVTDTTWHRMMWCTDDRHPEDILEHGHVDHIVRKAVAAGMNPVRAIQMATINCADYFGIEDAGAIAPGRRADMVTFTDINCPVVEHVIVKGKVVAQKGHMLPEFNGHCQVAEPSTPMTVNPGAVDFTISLPRDLGENLAVRVIGVVPDQVVTRALVMSPLQEDGLAVSDVKRDMLKIAVIERYTGKNGMAKGFVNGLGLKRGAIASTVAHDSHNIIVTGVDDGDMHAALRGVTAMGGGFVVVCNGRIEAKLPLPVAGLMSREPLYRVREMMAEVINAAGKLGTSLADPFMALGFLSLPVIPALKITDKGLVDVEKFQLVPLFCTQ
ncbi:MAG: adenine deaminase [Desulfamplus sp.]|nr:adenine deaminase [Desulfamplus sp.]